MPGIIIGRNCCHQYCWDIKRRGGCSDSDNKLHFSIILCKNTTSTKSLEVLPPISSEKDICSMLFVSITNYKLLII